MVVSKMNNGSCELRIKNIKIKPIRKLKYLRRTKNELENFKGGTEISKEKQLGVDRSGDY